MGDVGIGILTPAATLDVYATGTNSALVVPRDTAANRPTSAVNGMIRYNTNLARFEQFSAGSWRTLGASAVNTVGGSYSGTLDVSFESTIIVRLSAATSNCGTLNVTNTTPGQTFTVTLTNAQATCTITGNGSGSNVRLPSGYSSSLVVTGIVYTFLDDGNQLWVTGVNF